MKTKFYLLAGLLFLSLTISSVKLCAQEIILPLTENEEIRPKSMSLSISTTTTATEYVYASYNSSFLTVYFTNFRGTAVVTIEDLKGNVLIEVSKSFKANGTIVLPLDGLQTGATYLLRVKTKTSYLAYFKL